MFWCILFILHTVSADYPFRNHSLPWADRVDDLVGRLTLDEIRIQMSKGGRGPKGGPAPAIERLGIKPYSWNTECLRGDVSAGPATSFPQALGLGATFSPDLIFRVAQATGEEVRAKYTDYSRRGQYGDHKGISCFSPVINIVRDPRWGRNQETYGEDPHLTGVLASNFVKGLQGDDPRYIRANAGCKHFNVHGGPENIPVSRFSFDAKVSDRDWRTTFLPAFKACVKAGTYNLMCSYNSINGIPACANKKLLTDILRTEWGFKGYVISDQSAIERIITDHHYLNTSVDTVAACVRAGCNLELSKNLDHPIYWSVEDAISQGKLREEEVRANIKPLFYTRMRLGEFDPPEMNQYTKLNLSIIQNQPHRDLSLEAALKSIVLLKNTDNVLPLKTISYKTPAVVGPMANNSQQLFGHSSPDMDPKYTTNPLQGLRSLWPALKYAAGCKDNRCTRYNSQEVKKAVAGADIVFICLGTGQELESEGHDKPDLELFGQQKQLLQDAVNAAGGAKVILLLFNAGPLNVTWAADNSNVHAIVELFFPAQATGEALTAMLTAASEIAVPAGRLPVTWPKYMQDVPDITNYTMVGRTYRYFKAETLFPFGYGLSYTTFVYESLVYEVMVWPGEDCLGEIVLHNTGNYNADEVIQLYISWDKPSVTVPQLQLADFTRISVPMRSSVTWKFIISPESMAVWTDDNGWVIEAGTITFWVGGQQPGAKPNVGSNVKRGQFQLMGQKILGKY